MNNEPIPGFQVIPPAGIKPKPKTSGVAVFLQILTLVFAVPALIFEFVLGLAGGPSGQCNDRSGLNALGGVEVLALAVLVGLPTLIIGVSIRKGSPILHWLCIIMALAIWAVPLIFRDVFATKRCP